MRVFACCRSFKSSTLRYDLVTSSYPTQHVNAVSGLETFDLRVVHLQGYDAFFYEVCQADSAVNAYGTYGKRTSLEL